jgi:hypothetical protein
LTTPQEIVMDMRWSVVATEKTGSKSFLKQAFEGDVETAART